MAHFWHVTCAAEWCAVCSSGWDEPLARVRHRSQRHKAREHHACDRRGWPLRLQVDRLRRSPGTGGWRAVCVAVRDRGVFGELDNDFLCSMAFVCLCCFVCFLILLVTHINNDVTMWGFHFSFSHHSYLLSFCLFWFECMKIKYGIHL